MKHALKVLERVIEGTQQGRKIVKLTTCSLDLCIACRSTTNAIFIVR